jgi:hypothetical protein
MTANSGRARQSASPEDVAGVRDRRPWSPPKVILSNSVSAGVAQDNKGQFNIPDQKYSSTSTS